MKSLKKVLALFLCILCVLPCLFSCSAKGKTLAEVKAVGKLVVATSPDFPPFESLSGNNEVVGIEVDIMKIICERLGVTLELQQMDFESVLPGIKAGKYDVGMSGITVTEDRQKNALFTVPYCLAAQAIVVKAGSMIQSKSDLTGKTIAVQTGTTAESFCLSAGYTIKGYAANNDAESALVSDKADAWVIDDLTAADMVKSYNETHTDKLVILDEAMTTEPYAFAFTFGSEDLVAEINTILTGLIADGTIADIFASYEAPYTQPEVE